jgi:pyruvate carboxylase
MILVTGGTGVIGSELLRLLSQARIPARALVRNPNKAQELPGITWVVGDLARPEVLTTAFEGAKTVFLLIHYFEDMVELQHNAIVAARAAGVTHVVKEGQEISVDIDQGKALVMRLQGRTELEEEGQSKLFFELNGQARMVRVDRAGAVKLVTHPRAQDGNANHVGTPMPGMVVTLAVKAGQKVAKGDPLVSIEAMKMETMIRAERDAVVKHTHVKPGAVVAAKDLMIELGD